MADPTSSAAGGVIAWKALGGLAAAAGLAAALAAVVSMCMMTPRSKREWAVGLISTIVASLGGGALAVLKLGVLPAVLPVNDPLQMLMLISGVGGLMFACGLPGWAIVRAVFTLLAKREGKDIGELVQDARKVLP
jgi:hypothetical protein